MFLSALAQRTKRLRFGPLVYVLPLYDPLRLAEEIALLDQLSGGRLELGVGRGASSLESALFGAETDRDQFQEALEVVVRALTEERLTCHGHFYDYEDVPITLQPFQRPYPPLWFGIGRPEAAVWAAENEVNAVALLPAPLVRPIADRYRAEWARLGKPAANLPFIGINRPLVLAESDAAALRIASRAYRRWKRNLDWLWDERARLRPPAGRGGGRELHGDRPGLRRHLVRRGRADGRAVRRDNPGNVRRSRCQLTSSPRKSGST